jgi:SAM-dependent methyltransferase
MTDERERRLVFGEVAENYDAVRPAYPDELFDVVMAYGGLRAGEPALEIGAGTGRATKPFTERGLRVHALEPSPGMAKILRRKGFDPDVRTFEEYEGTNDFALAFAAQAWHWVHSDDRYEKLARVVRPGGMIALMWNTQRPHPEPIKTDNDAVYARLWPDPDADWKPVWKQGDTRAEIEASGAFVDIETPVVTWDAEYRADDWIRMLQTASDHRMLPDDVRRELHEGVHAAIMKHGGVLPVTYDTELYLARSSVRR